MRIFNTIGRGISIVKCGTEVRRNSEPRDAENGPPGPCGTAVIGVVIGDVVFQKCAADQRADGHSHDRVYDGRDERTIQVFLAVPFTHKKMNEMIAFRVFCAFSFFSVCFSFSSCSVDKGSEHRRR